MWLMWVLLKLSYFLKTLFSVFCLKYTILSLLWLVENASPSIRDRNMRSFFNVDIVCEVISLKIALFYVCTIIVDKFKRLYESNRSVIKINCLIYLDIIWQLESLYILFSHLHLTISSLLFQYSIVLYNQLTSYMYGLL